MPIERINRSKMNEQDAKERAKNFDEVALGYDLETAQREAARCLNCKNAPCKRGCPVGIDIPSFLHELKDGNVAAAAQTITETNSLPSICGRVCPQENQCEKLCVRAKMEGAVAIGNCERFVGDFALKSEQKQPVVERIGKKVAVIGSGPAGLSCAAELAKNGCDVTILEAFHKAGGVLVYGIPEFRLPKQIVQKEINKVLSLGVKLELNSVAGKTQTIEELKSEYDAIFIGSGAGLPMFLGIKGENLNGVMSANEYLTRINLMKAYLPSSDTPQITGKNVCVIGAGNVAMDAARTALRLGAQSVSIIYRRGEEEIPARKEEVHHAKEEGVIFRLLTNPVEILGEDGFVCAIRCVKMMLGEMDASGRRSPIEVSGSEFMLETDMVIVSLGTSPNPLITDSYSLIETTKRGTLVVDEQMQTSVDGIYAGGDAVTGAATVILAMGAGIKAANSILERFKNSK